MQHTARSAEFMEKEGRAKAISTCKLLELDGIVAWAMTSDILLDIAGRLLGFPQAPDWPLSRPVEHALRRGFSAPVGRLFPHLRAGVSMPGYGSFSYRIGQ